MKNYRRLFGGMVVGIAALAFSSCAYDPYLEGSSYSTSGYGGGYGGGYGDGYGYGGSGFSTSVFISTGNPRWGYDPYAGAYYDYTRRSYYDPYLYGYYPVGYRPRYVYGAPHPHGWRQGRSYIAPPSRIRSSTLSNYHQRAHRYRDLGHNWSGNIQPDRHQHGGRGSRGSRDGSSWRGGQNYQDRDPRQQYSSPQSPDRRSRGGSQWGNTAVIAPQPNRDAGGSRLTGGRGRQVDPQQNEQRLREFQQRTQQQQYQQQSMPQRSGRSGPQMQHQVNPQRQPQAIPQRQEQAVPQMRERPTRGERSGGWDRGSQEENRDRGRGRGPRGLGEG